MRIFLTLLLTALAFSLTAQDSFSAYKFRVFLNDKGTNNYTVSNPSAFLSEEAIARKKQQGVTIDESDFPISPDYMRQVEMAGGKVVSFSKWFSTLVVEVSDSASINKITQLPFVKSAKYVWRGKTKATDTKGTKPRPRLRLIEDFNEQKTPDFFGRTAKQFKLHNAQGLVESGLSGRNMIIAIIDAGFTNVDVIPQFANARIVEARTFVPNAEVYNSSSHGTGVLSTISVNVPNVMIGSARNARFYLLQSEDATSEYPVEEDYWIRAIEYADSVGVDVVNTSLGYNDFDDPSLSYSQSDLTGKVSLMSLAATKAYDKGLLLMLSAGNSGNKAWQKTTPPGDAENVITVGATDSDGVIANFSSKGPTADGRIKPDVSSVGRGTAVISQTGMFSRSNGTSFSTPFMAGLVTSLWGINPSMHRRQVMDIVIESSDRYHNPDTIYGNGLPNIEKAMTRMLASLPTQTKTIKATHINIEKQAGRQLQVALSSEYNKKYTYNVTLLSEDGKWISKHQLTDEFLLITLPDKVGKRKQIFHIVFDAPSGSEVVRFEI